MAWLRLDDGFPHHPKVVELTIPERWAWIEVLTYCARFKTQGFVAPTVREAVPRATTKMLGKFAAVGLLDEHDDGWEVHDWAEYNPADPTAAERMRRHRERNANRNAARNGVTPPVTDESVTDTVTVTPPRVRASTRDPVPVPSPELQESANALSPEIEDDPHDEVAVQRVYSCWRRTFGKTRANYNKLLPARRKVIKRWLKTFSPEDLCRALDGVKYETPQWWVTHNDLDVVFRSQQRIERFIEFAENPPAAEVAHRGNGTGMTPAEIVAYTKGRP